MVPFLVLLLACGDSSQATPDAAVDAGFLDAPDALGTCRVVTDVGATITVMNVATATPPPAGGGAIPDGTYKLTAASIYTGVGGASGPTGTAISETSYLASGFSHDVTTVNGTPTFADYTVATSGTSVTVTQTCPSTAVTTFDGYTSNGGVVTFYDSHDGASREYTKGP